MIAHWLIGAALAGPADRALAHGDAPPHRAVAAAHAAARTASRLPARPHRGATVRGLAWISVGRLGVLDDQVLRAAGPVLLSPAVPETVRSRAAWALGEIGRARPWAEAAPVAALLQQAMHGAAGPELAWQLVEAHAKVYPPHSHSFAERLAATRALNALAAGQGSALPGVYYVLLDRVMTIEVATQLVQESVAAARRHPSEAALAEATSAVLLAVRWLATQQEVLLASLDTRRTATETAFTTLLSALELGDRRLTLVLFWTLGEVAGDPAFSGWVGPGIAARGAPPDPVVRILHAWALYQLRTDPDARAALRHRLLAEERAPLVYRTLAGLRAHPQELDALQKLLGFEPSAEAP